MSVPNPLLTDQAGFELLTESGQVIELETGGIDVTSSLPYQALITSEFNQKNKFMGLVALLCTGLGDCTAAINSLVPAFTLGTAVGAQLDIIGLWIGQSRVINDVLTLSFFGFSELSTGLPDGNQMPFGELTNQSIGGQWYELGAAYGSTTVLSDPAYLTVLKARICRNQSNGTLSAIENALSFIFGVGCAVTDNGNLTLQIETSSPVTPVDQALLQTLDILPRPAGVAITSITYG